jgi:hypothetical protein
MAVRRQSAKQGFSEIPLHIAVAHLARQAPETFQPIKRFPAGLLQLLGSAMILLELVQQCFHAA